MQNLGNVNIVDNIPASLYVLEAGLAIACMYYYVSCSMYDQKDGMFVLYI